MKTYLILLLATTSVIFSCKKEDLALTGAPSAIGAVGNELTFSNTIPNLGAIVMTVTAFHEGISTLQASAEITNADLLEMATHVAGLYPNNITIVGNTVTVNMQARFTTDGIAAIAPNGEELVVCKYNASEGNEWTMDADGNTIRHKVTHKSTENDYHWSFFDIKVVKMEATNYGIPGLNKVEYISNHKYGPVGVKAYLTDGTVWSADIFSLNDNE
ncbi:MAG: hypothetical protein GY751_03200 [Bacteroidetes bacterium]|nr:hypothetical protein [Bacteroidota bacterium]